MRCGLINGAQALVTDYQYECHSEDSSKRCYGSKRPAEFDLFTGTTGNKGLDKWNAASSGQKITAIDTSFDDVKNVLDINNSTFQLAKEIFDMYGERENASFKGDSRRPMIVAACIMFAMRDAKEGALREDEICKKLVFKEVEFGKICIKLQNSFLSPPACNDVITRCFKRDMGFADMLGRMLSKLCHNVLNNEEKGQLRKTINRIDDAIRDNVEYQQFPIEKKIGGIIWASLTLLSYQHRVTIKQVSSECGLCDPTIKSASEFVRGLLRRKAK